MIERMAAQNGMFSALNTVTKLLYTSKNDMKGTDPNVAALLQTYAKAHALNASAVESNPGRPFFATDINNKFRGVVSPQEATRSFISDQFGVEPELGLYSPNTNEASSYVIDKARIVRMYDLENPDTMNEFMNNVLYPFLAISITNAKLLKVMKHQDYYDMTKSALTVVKDMLSKARDKIPNKLAKGRFELTISDRQDPDNFDIRWQKLLSLVPTKAEEFYDGMDYALVAHPLFMSDSLGIAAMNKNLIKHIAKIVKNYPSNAKEAVSASQVRVYSDPAAKLAAIFRPQDAALYEMMQSQTEILKAGTTADETLEH